MKVLPITNNYCHAKKEQNPSFKTNIVKNDTFKKTFDHAEKMQCRYFVPAIKNLLKDNIHRTLELTSGVFLSKDGVQYTKTKLTCDGKENEYVGFPHIYGTTNDEMIANDGRLLVIDFAKGYQYKDFNGHLSMNKDETLKEYKELRKQLFK